MQLNKMIELKDAKGILCDKRIPSVEKILVTTVWPTMEIGVHIGH